MTKAWLVLALLLVVVGPAIAEDITPHELLSIINERDKYYNQRFVDSEKSVSAALAAADKATAKAETSSDKRFDGVNEFRSTLKDQQINLVTRNEVEVRFKALEDKIAANNQQITQLIARAEGAAQLWGIITVGIGLVIAAMMMFMTFRKSVV